MSVTRVMRGLACAIAVAAVVDPAVRSARKAPLAIALRASDGRLVPGSETAGVPAEATVLRAQLTAAMPGALAINTMAESEALIVAGSRLDPSAIPERGPISFVLPAAGSGPKVQVLSVTDPRPVLPGWSAVVAAEVAGREQVPGSSSTIVLESHGVEVDRFEHKWTRADERFTARLAFAPPTSGTFSLGVRVLPAAGETGSPPAPLPTRVLADSRRLKILAFDPRPSWGSGFARRALEEDPDFEVVTRVRASRGLEVRTGAAPLVLSGAALDPFDLVLVGAPEELTAGEVAALESFARRRGGTVALLADRKPAGPYVRLLGATFDEALLEKPLRLTAADGTSIRASELASPRTLPPGAEPIVTVPQGSGVRAPMLSIPLGTGRIVFAGLLDAWRYRGDDDEVFAAFWRSQLGSEAARAPRRIEVTLTPGVALAGSRVRVRAVVRATDMTLAANAVATPGVTARVVDERGAQAFVRLWPTPEPGILEGWLEATGPGRYHVRVETDAGASSDTPFMVAAGAPRDEPEAGGSSRAIAGATGGTSVTTASLEPLLEQLRAQPRASVIETRHPMRSPWWAVAFISLLSLEWAVRRRGGLR